LVRRSVRHGKQLGIDKPFLADLSQEVVESMQGAYPVLGEKNKIIRRVIREEEESFLGTLEQGLKLFEEMAAEHAGEKLIAGEAAFKLHDTYGFPIELTVELSAEKGYRVDLAGFEKEMEAQRERARQTGIEGEKKKSLVGLDLAALKPTNFTGHEKTSEETKAVALFPAQKLVVLEKTPFYGESGGQIGDTGIFSWNGKETRVLNTLISTTGVILHEVDELDGLKENSRVLATIDTSKRKATEAHHTATHLLHKALREVLGEHVKQAGSYVGPDKLRFDFTHFHALAPDELQKIELAVNKKISEKIKVEVLQRSYKDARKMGAVALFGEKYGDQVRVLKVGDYSLELCGGTHVKSTADILFFKIISEGALGSGIRRIEALAGQAAKVFSVYQAKSLRDEVEALIRRYKALQIEKEKLGGIRSLETNIFEIESGELESLTKAIDNQDSADVNKFLDHLSGRVDWLKERVARAEKEIEGLKSKKAREESSDFVNEVKVINAKKVLLKEFKEYNMDMLRTVSDSMQGSLKSCVLLLASAFPGRLIYLVTVTSDLAAQGFSAGKIAEAFSGVVGGKGGGKDTKVEGGGKDPNKIPEGFEAVVRLLG
jgi:alanyl-tRNA synthetase